MAKNVVFLIHGAGVHAGGWNRAEVGPVVALGKTAEHNKLHDVTAVEEDAAG